MQLQDLLIVLNGIETKDQEIMQEWVRTFNRTKWN